MEEIVTKVVVEKTKYKTSDGEIYEEKDRAELHENALKFERKVKDLKCVNGAYYCETQEDFDAIVDWKAYSRPYYDFHSSSYKPRYEYSKKTFKGPDWYFFQWEPQDDNADDYWVETLSEKKAEWEEFYNQFVDDTSSPAGNAREIEIGDFVSYKYNGEIFTGTVIAALTKEEANQCHMMSRPFEIKRNDGLSVKVMEYDIVAIL